MTTRLTRGARPTFGRVFRPRHTICQVVATTVMLQLVVPKFRHHPLSFASCATLQIDEIPPAHQGNRSRTVGDGQIISRLDSPDGIFSVSLSVTNIHTIRLP